MDNDECKSVYNAVRNLPEEGACAALAALLDAHGVTILLAMLATCCAVKEHAIKQARTVPAQSNAVN